MGFIPGECRYRRPRFLHRNTNSCSKSCRRVSWAATCSSCYRASYDKQKDSTRIEACTDYTSQAVNKGIDVIGILTVSCLLESMKKKTPSEDDVVCYMAIWVASESEGKFLVKAGIKLHPIHSLRSGGMLGETSRNFDVSGQSHAFQDYMPMSQQAEIWTFLDKAMDFTRQEQPACQVLCSNPPCILYLFCHIQLL